MAKIKHINTGDIITVAKEPEFDGGIWECGNQRFTDPDGDEYEAVIELRPVINFTYPTAAERATNITVNVSVVNPADNSPIPVTETYYVPLLDVITGVMNQMLVVPIVNGVGQAVFSVATPGRYSIKTDLILPVPTAAFSETPDIAIF